MAANAKLDFMRIQKHKDVFVLVIKFTIKNKKHVKHVINHVKHALVPL